MHIWPFCPTHIEALGKAHTSLGVVAFSCILAPLCYLRFLLLSLKRNHFPVLEHERQVSSQLTKPFWLLGEYCDFSFRSVMCAMYYRSHMNLEAETTPTSTNVIRCHLITVYSCC